MNSTRFSDTPPHAVTTPKDNHFDVAELLYVHSIWVQLQVGLEDASQVLFASLSEQRSSVSDLTDWACRIESHVQETRANVETLGSALDRIKLVALNMGLEGARLGDLAGKLLVNVSDELRQLSARSLEILMEQVSSIERLEAERRRLMPAIERIRTQTETLSELCDNTERLKTENLQGIERFTNELERVTGLDAAAREQIARITEQAKSLVSSLGSLEKPSLRRLMREALLSELAPILRLLSTENVTTTDR
jgi:ferritin-like metal-binding protein YciE